jgi:hypothetical protein
LDNSNNNNKKKKRFISFFMSAQPSRLGASPAELPPEPTFYSADGNPVGDIWTSKTVAKAIAAQVKGVNSQSRQWNKDILSIQKEFDSYVALGNERRNRRKRRTKLI